MHNPLHHLRHPVIATSATPAQPIQPPPPIVNPPRDDLHKRHYNKQPDWPPAFFYVRDSVQGAIVPCLIKTLTQPLNFANSYHKQHNRDQHNDSPHAIIRPRRRRQHRRQLQVSPYPARRPANAHSQDSHGDNWPRRQR